MKTNLKKKQKRCIGDIELLKRSGNMSIVFIYLQSCAQGGRATQITVTSSMTDVSRASCSINGGDYAILRLQ